MLSRQVEIIWEKELKHLIEFNLIMLLHTQCIMDQNCIEMQKQPSLKEQSTLQNTNVFFVP